MKRRPNLLLVGLGLLAFSTLLVVWRERHRQQAHAHQALIFASREHSALQEDSLLEQGADSSVRDKPEMPRVQSEIPQNAAPQPSDPLTESALMAAARQGDLERVQSLLAAGAQVNAANGGETALTLALDESRSDIMLTLLAHGANANVKATAAAHQPLPLLVQTLQTFNRPVYGETTCRTVVRRLLENGADVNAADSEGYAPLGVALAVQEPEIAVWLIQHGADVNHHDQQEETPLHGSAWNPESRGVMTLLLQRGAEVAPAHNGGWNILCWAAERDDLSMARKMLQKGVGVHSRDGQRRTPLMYAAAHGANRVLNLLLAEGADVNARDALGWTALMFAAQTDDVTIAQALRLHGANRRLRDHENHWTAEERAVHVGQQRMAVLLRTGHAGRAPKPEPKWWLAQNGSNATAQRTRAQVDAYRWVKAVHLPNIPQEAGEGACGVVVVDADGKQGEPFGGDKFFFLPEIQVFHDTDGHPYAFLQGHNRSETHFIVAIEGRTLVQKCDFYVGDYPAFCQPLRGGGALVIGFETTYDKMEGKPIQGIPIPHQNDEMASVSRFRHGKLTDLDTIYLPQQ